MTKQLKQNLITIFFAALALASVIYIDRLFDMVIYLSHILLPLIVGATLAFMLNVPMKAFEKLVNNICDKTKLKISHSRIQTISLLMAVLSIFIILIGVISVLVPNLIATVNNIVAMTTSGMPDFIAELKKYNIDNSYLIDFLNSLDIEAIFTGVLGSFGSITSIIFSTIGAFFTFIMSFTITVYILLDKNKLEIQMKKIIYAYIPTKKADKICEVGSLINDTYYKFFSGQCIEALIVGVILFITLSVFQIPYASVISVMAAVFSFVPYIGSIIACTIGAFLILFIDPYLAVLEVVIYQSVQFVEDQFIYPRVVGGSVGLSPLYTLLAALIGGKAFGLFGVIFAIPLAAVIYILIKENVDIRLEKKKILILKKTPKEKNCNT